MSHVEKSSITLHQQVLSKGVLVVEDSELQRSILVEMLNQFGVSRVLEAGNGIEALDQLTSCAELPSVIIIDLHMPKMDGIQLIQQLSERKLHLPIVVISSAETKLLDTIGSLVDACQMSLLGALAKPIHGNTLFESLQRYRQLKLAQQDNSVDQAPAIADLKRAIRAGHIIPYYQPKVSLTQKQAVGMEALARWQDPIKGLLPPAQFIQLAEDQGLLKELTLNLLETVLADMVAWNRLNLFPVVSINIAVTLLEDRQFADQFIRSVINAHIDPKHILLEITESALMKDPVTALATIGRLKLKGFCFSIDDYGTGFSSMQQLSRIAFNELKIDRSFIYGAPSSEHMTNILQSAIDMGHRLNLTTVAEGVETQEELNLLKKLGCDQVQGFLFAKPMPVGDILPWLMHQRERIKQFCS